MPAKVAPLALPKCNQTSAECGKRQPRADARTAVKTWKTVSSRAENVKSLSLPCLWEKERRRRDAILLLSFSTCSLYFYGTVWLRRSAPGVWRQRGRTGGSGWRWGARFLTGPWLCRINWRTPELLSWLDSSLKNRTPRIRACGMGLGPGLSRIRSSELDKLGRRRLRCWLCFFFVCRLKWAAITSSVSSVTWHVKYELRRLKLY